MLVGRSVELSEATRSLLGGASLAVTGEAGAGKTVLTTAAIRATGRPVVSGQCFRSLAWTPGLPLQQALGRLLPAGDPSWAAQWVVRSCGNALLRLDDLQWADPLTLAVVALLPPATVLAATIRLGDPGTEAALDAVRAAGARVLELPPLDLDEATELAGQVHPRLRRGEARALAERCGGNPLLIRELGDDPEPSMGLRRSVTGRLRRLGTDVATGFCLLALADEPLPQQWLPETAALVAAGFAVLSNGMVQPRHALLAEVVIADLDDGDPTVRTTVARELARRAELGGNLALTARGLAAADEPARAVDYALRAAEQSDRPGERAGLLHLAATCADDELAAELATRAVEELVAAGEYVQAGSLLDQLPDVGGAHWASLVGRVRWQLGDDTNALAAYETGLATAAPGTRDAVLLQIEYARATLIGLGDTPRALDLARAAYEQSVHTGFEQARALAVLGSAENFAAVPGAADHLIRGIDQALRDGDVMVEFTSANNLIAVYESEGRTDEALALADRFAERAESLRMRQWQQQMRAMGLNVRMHAGDYDAVVSQVPTLLAGALDRRTRDQLAVTLGLALVDVGRIESALECTEQALALCANDHSGLGNLLWVRSEAHLWAGDAAAACAGAMLSMQHMPADGRRLFPLLTLAHGRVQLGQPVPAEEWPHPYVPVLAGALPELAGLVAQSAGDRAVAAAHFTAAAAVWAGHHRRGELRCRWLAAAVDDDVGRARHDLADLERDLAAGGLTPLLGRVRQTLRARGVHSSAPRGRAGELTTREREVLDLVAEGLSTEAVAARLGLAPSTVAAQIASARARLGATTRWQAASG